MCQICKTAGGELEQFLDELVEKFPGTEIEGRKVEKDHHVEVALINAVAKRLSLPAKMVLAEGLGMELLVAAAAREAAQPVRGPFGDGKVIEA